MPIVFVVLVVFLLVLWAARTRGKNGKTGKVEKLGNNGGCRCCFFVVQVVWIGAAVEDYIAGSRELPATMMTTSRMSRMAMMA